MSNIPPAAPSTAETAVPSMPPAHQHQSVRDVLPAGIKVDHTHSADTFFAAHEAANAKPGTTMEPESVIPQTAPASVSPKVAPVAVTSKPSDAPPASKVEEPIVPSKGSLTEKLAAKGKAVVIPQSTEPKAGDNPEDAVTLDPSYSQAAHESFKKIKTITGGLRDQLNAARETERQLRSQIDASKSTTLLPDVAQLERLRGENKALSDRLMLVDLREHPKFQAEFIQPQQQALNDAAAILAANGIANGDVQNLLSRPRAELGKAVSELSKNLPDFDRSEFSDNIRKAWTLNQQANAALSKSHEVYGGLRNQTDAQQKQAFERTWGRAAGQVAEHIVELEVPDDATPELRSEIESYNAAYKGLRTVAENRAFGPMTTDAVAEAAIKSAAYDFHIQKAMPKLMKEIDGLITTNRGLIAQINAIKSRNPNLQISGQSAPGSVGGLGPDGTLSLDQLSKMGHAEAAAALAPRMAGR